MRFLDGNFKIQFHGMRSGVYFSMDDALFSVPSQPDNTRHRRRRAAVAAVNAHTCVEATAADVHKCGICLDDVTLPEDANGVTQCGECRAFLHGACTLQWVESSGATTCRLCRCNWLPPAAARDEAYERDAYQRYGPYAPVYQRMWQASKVLRTDITADLRGR